MYDSTLGEAWCKLLFNAVSIPFVVLLTVLIASQTLIAKNNADTETPSNPSETVGNVLF